MRRLLCLALAVVIGWLLPSAASAEEVGTSAAACVIIDAESGRILLSHNAESPLPMASTTKVMTALLSPAAAAPLAFPERAYTWRRVKR